MPIPAFGFSASDFVALANLLYKVGKAVDIASEDFEEFREAQKELNLFKDSLSLLEQTIAAGTPVTREDVKRLRSVLDEGLKDLRKFDAFVAKYTTGAVEKDGVKSIVKFWKRVPYTLSGKNKIHAFRRGLHSCFLTLSVVLQILNSQAMQDVSQQFQKGNDRLALHLQNSTEEVKLRIGAALDDPWDQKPIRFQDAIGRRYPIPLEVCKSFQGLMAFLQYAFQETPALPAVLKETIWLFIPSATPQKRWYLINEEDWDNVARPGMQLGMSFVGGQQDGEEPADEEPDELIDLGKGSVRFQTPLPYWSTYPEDTDFEFLSQRRQVRKPSRRVLRRLSVLSCPAGGIWQECDDQNQPRQNQSYRRHHRMASVQSTQSTDPSRLVELTGKEEEVRID
ncbi:hypothetical protein GQ44DRAFT_832694 [Phaeosphaeriaceae sp. PMI808]|nr:hypothetical protein GQ44DRAFT_832694 [Phaeosphaeriaceae sp. PMI808]